MLASFYEIDPSFVYSEVRTPALFVGTLPLIVLINASFEPTGENLWGFDATSTLLFLS
jgi:hypothetical protein